MYIHTGTVYACLATADEKIPALHYLGGGGYLPVTSVTVNPDLAQ